MLPEGAVHQYNAGYCTERFLHLIIPELISTSMPLGVYLSFWSVHEMEICLLWWYDMISDCGLQDKILLSTKTFLSFLSYLMCFISFDIIVLFSLLMSLFTFHFAHWSFSMNSMNLTVMAPVTSPLNHFRQSEEAFKRSMDPMGEGWFMGEILAQISSKCRALTFVLFSVPFPK